MIFHKRNPNSQAAWYVRPIVRLHDAMASTGLRVGEAAQQVLFAAYRAAHATLEEGSLHPISDEAETLADNASSSSGEIPHDIHRSEEELGESISAFERRQEALRDIALAREAGRQCICVHIGFYRCENEVANGDPLWCTECRPIWCLCECIGCLTEDEEWPDHRRWQGVLHLDSVVRTGDGGN